MSRLRISDEERRLRNWESYWRWFINHIDMALGKESGRYLAFYYFWDLENRLSDIFDGWGITRGRFESYGHARCKLEEVYKERGIQKLCGGCSRGCKVVRGDGWTNFTCFDYMAEIVIGDDSPSAK